MTCFPRAIRSTSCSRSTIRPIRKAYGVEASTFGGYAYDAFLLVTSAIKKSGTTPEQIRNGIEQATKAGQYFRYLQHVPKDHNGLDLSAFEMVKIVKGDWALVK